MQRNEQPRDSKGRFRRIGLFADELHEALDGLRRAFDENAPTDEIEDTSRDLVRVLGRTTAHLFVDERDALTSLLDHPSMGLVPTSYWNVLKDRADAAPASEDDVERERQIVNDKQMRGRREGVKIQRQQANGGD